eukprot:Opistho-2@24963
MTVAGTSGGEPSGVLMSFDGDAGSDVESAVFAAAAEGAEVAPDGAVGIVTASFALGCLSLGLSWWRITVAVLTKRVTPAPEGPADDSLSAGDVEKSPLSEPVIDNTRPKSGGACGSVGSRTADASSPFPCLSFPASPRFLLFSLSFSFSFSFVLLLSPSFSFDGDDIRGALAEGVMLYGGAAPMEATDGVDAVLDCAEPLTGVDGALCFADEEVPAGEIVYDALLPTTSPGILMPAISSVLRCGVAPLDAACPIVFARNRPSRAATGVGVDASPGVDISFVVLRNSSILCRMRSKRACRPGSAALSRPGLPGVSSIFAGTQPGSAAEAV